MSYIRCLLDFSGPNTNGVCKWRMSTGYGDEPSTGGFLAAHLPSTHSHLSLSSSRSSVRSPPRSPGHPEDKGHLLWPAIRRPLLTLAAAAKLPLIISIPACDFPFHFYIIHIYTGHCDAEKHDIIDPPIQVLFFIFTLIEYIQERFIMTKDLWQAVATQVVYAAPQDILVANIVHTVPQKCVWKPAHWIL